MAEFIKTIATDEWEVETDTGWKPIKGIGKTIEYDEYEVETETCKGIFADEHIFFDKHKSEIFLKDLKENDKIFTKNGLEIPNITKNGKKSHMYDLIMDDTTDHRYYTNDILSHNSIWLGNIATNPVLNGYNVLLISVEMGIAKIHRRVGANLFDIPMDKYRDFANDDNRILSAMHDFREKQGITTIPLGTLRTKRFTKCTPEDVRLFVLNVEETLGIKVHLVVLDYLTELQSNYGTLASDNSYRLHKDNANDLHAMAEDHQWAIVTAHQLKISGYGADDLTLNMIGESSGIIHKPDNIFGIIQSAQLKMERSYVLKNLKGRESAYKHYYIKYKIDYNYMRINEIEGMIEPGNLII
jgi:hypothetical protein